MKIDGWKYLKKSYGFIIEILKEKKFKFGYDYVKYIWSDILKNKKQKRQNRNHSINNV